MNPITIRNLGPEDAHVLERVRDGVFDDPIDPSWAFGFLATRVNEIVVALDQGEVIGFASGTVLMHPDKPFSFFVNEVGVHEDYQRRGIATRLMNRLCDLARDRGCEGIWVATEDDNDAARGLYRSLGARETSGVVVFDWDHPDL
ncbi:GNAT family N-acetyltransferase [Boseongicola aestuarii]|jgi:ribosomal protein S18 acetylase RimI-like enzyme|uniref:Acetyltransferase YpeA n=1 Tax=Boseongicola aestuarii TaxID=1470561 RepID=A0A238IZJ1_9RHOB|nr:GNAT family N-acetyltransferase [Boseongicola aestuarii]SMX23807.1 Acetyltransferase YpeA [Boseongicola aestuarii]